MKEKLLLLCTCTYIEIMTAVGVTGYLLFLNKPTIAVISAAVFLPLVLFHYIMEHTRKIQLETVKWESVFIKNYMRQD